MPSDVHGEVDVYVCHVCDELQVLVALLDRHDIEAEVVLFQNIHCLRKQDDGIGDFRLLPFVLDAVVVTLFDEVFLADFHKVCV